MNCRFHIVLAVILASLPAAASADILEWTDNAGVTHYTNLKGEVPSQQAAQVVVNEQIWLPQGPALPEVKDDPPPPAPVALPDPPPPRETADEVLRAYVAGLDSGLARSGSSGGSVYINGPLAVTVSPPPSYVNDVLPSDYWLPAYTPFLTTAVIARHRGPVQGRVGKDFRGAHRRTAGHSNMWGHEGSNGAREMHPRWARW